MRLLLGRVFVSRVGSVGSSTADERCPNSRRRMPTVPRSHDSFGVLVIRSSTPMATSRTSASTTARSSTKSVIRDLVDSYVLIADLRGIDVARHGCTGPTETGPLAMSTPASPRWPVECGRQNAERSPPFWRSSASRVRADRLARSSAHAGPWPVQHRDRLARLPVAATAQVEGLELATPNTKHFPMFKGLAAPFDLEPPSLLSRPR